MNTKRATIEVSEEVAKAFRHASSEQRRRAEKALRFALLSRGEVAEAFRRITSRTREYAERQGLTDEKLDDLLKDDAE